MLFYWTFYLLKNLKKKNDSFHYNIMQLIVSNIDYNKKHFLNTKSAY